MTYQPTPTKTRAGDDFVSSSDPALQQLLVQMLVVLEKINIHLSLGSDSVIENDEKL